MSEFAKRGLTRQVVTVETAELDAALHGISEPQMQRIARSLRIVPLSEGDRFFGSLQMRTIDGYDVVFQQTVMGDQVTVAIGMIVPEGEIESDANGMAILERIAMLRGAFGI